MFWQCTVVVGRDVEISVLKKRHWVMIHGSEVGVDDVDLDTLSLRATLNLVGDRRTGDW